MEYNGDGWVRMGGDEGEDHYFCEQIALCGRFFLRTKKTPKSRTQSFPACAGCIVLRYLADDLTNL